MASEEELREVRERLVGQAPEARISRVRVERPGGDVVQGFLALTDLCSTVADALDELGVGGVAAGSAIAPVVTDGPLCGPAITVRYGGEGASVGAHRGRGARSGLADRDLYGIGEPGDVAVFECDTDAGAVVGSLSVRWARRLGIAGCVVDGAVRDLASLQEIGVPVWARATTPASGKHRMRALELNGSVVIGGVTVAPGDLVTADETGVCVIPAGAAAEVLDRCRAIEAAEHELERLMDTPGEAHQAAALMRGA